MQMELIKQNSNIARGNGTSGIKIINYSNDLTYFAHISVSLALHIRHSLKSPLR